MLTLEMAQAQWQAWYNASLALARNQSYTIEGRTLTRANTQDVQQQLDYWQGKINELTPGKNRRVYYIV